MARDTDKLPHHPCSVLRRRVDRNMPLSVMAVC